MLTWDGKELDIKNMTTIKTTSTIDHLLTKDEKLEQLGFKLVGTKVVDNGWSDPSCEMTWESGKVVYRKKVWEFGKKI